MAYETDEQQAEALKKWWSENGKQVIIGAVVGLAAVFGWRAWQAHLGEVSATAAEALDRMMQVSAQGEQDQAMGQGQKILDEYGKSVYADFASLSMAAMLVKRDDEQGAMAHLQRIIDQDRDRALTDLARLRLARLLLSQQRGAEAKALLDKIGSAYQAEVASVRGDISLAAGDLKAARDAYQKAIATGLADSDLIRLKLDELAVSETH